MNLICDVSGERFLFSKREQEFLKRIAPTFDGQRFELPPPRLSPKERLRLRTIHRNEQHLYRNKSAFSGEPLVSVYPESLDAPVVSRADWFSDSWDGLDYGQEFDFERSFFSQYAELQRKIPRAATVTINNENSEFTTGTGYCKNCYLINSSEYAEDCYYSKLLQNCKDVVDSAYCYDSELLYECFDVKNCYDCRWVYHSQGCNNCWFSEDLRRCTNCFLCTNLVGQEYYILNEKVPKEEYLARVAEITSSSEKLAAVKRKFFELRKKRIYKYANIVNCERSSGDFISNSKNCENCYDVNDSEDCMHVHVGVKVKDLIDCSNVYIEPELCYQVLGALGISDVHFSLYIFHSSDIWYSEQCFSCHHCFGCVGLRNKSYCIFNKQYSPEDYGKTVARIISHMQQSGEWGSFFPAELSPFPYNKSVAQEYYPLEQAEAQARDYAWEEPEAKEYQPPTAEVPAQIGTIDESICKETFACAASGKNYRIQPDELRFYQQMKLPLPQLCPDVRYAERMSLRKPRQLFERSCDACGEALLSPFAPEAEERVLCERDYLAAVS